MARDQHRNVGLTIHCRQSVLHSRQKIQRPCCHTRKPGKKPNASCPWRTRTQPLHNLSVNGQREVRRFSRSMLRLWSPLSELSRNASQPLRYPSRQSKPSHPRLLRLSQMLTTSCIQPMRLNCQLLTRPVVASPLLGVNKNQSA